MTSEQNVPEVQSHQGSPMSAGQQDGDAQFSGAERPPRHGAVQEQPPSPPQAQEQRASTLRKPHSLAGTANSRSVPFRPPLQRPSQPQAPQGFQDSGQQQQNGGGSSTGKRWKKKFRDRDRQRSPENPGNVAGSSNNGGGFRDGNTHQPGNNAFKRKGGRQQQQQRGPRSFVGPMDHSYRAVNGNFADTPPSTIETHGNFQGRARRRARLSERFAADRLLAGPRHSHSGRCADQDLLLHRRSLLHREDSGDRAQAGSEGRLRQERQGVDCAVDQRRGRGSSGPDRLRPQQRERQAADPDSRS